MSERDDILTRAINRFGIATPATSTEVVLALDALAKGPDEGRALEARGFLRSYLPAFTVDGVKFSYLHGCFR